MSLVSRIDALKMAQNLGCQGAHQDEKGNWMPCSSMEEMNKISNRAEPRKNKKSEEESASRSNGKKKRRSSNWNKIKKNSQDEWEKLGSRGVISIDTLPSGGLVSGPVMSSKTVNPCWDGYIMDGMKKGKRGKLVPNCVPTSKKALQGPEYVRDNDPDVFTDIESARMRSRQLGCIGVSRRISKNGRTVWMPCTNMSDYARLAGTTALGRRHQRRAFENSVRTILMSNDRRPKRKVSIYEELYKK